MKVTKPAWVQHNVGEKKNSRCPIYSLSVHPDGTRLATGGLDQKVKIWSTLPILEEDAAADDANHKLLCTMTAHTGSVLAVRWAHHGRFLATGADDAVVMIWGIDPDGGGRLFGSDEVNVESWKPLTRLVGHQADIVDIAWSRDDAMLATVGLDSTIWIWDGRTFERIKKIDTHKGFVKGVTWDPVGNYLATQSDDKTVKIWNTEDWSLVESVGRPFENSPSSTFFRRLSWSPDGAFIAASNAMNGPVFVAAVIEREGWQSDISFVGHENTIQVAAFNPRLFFTKGEEPTRITASCMVALGANDFSISIWRNTMHKPLVVLHDIFGRNLMDLCWSNDGLHLYGCSEDGTICAIAFEPSEFPELGALEKTQLVLDQYNYQPKAPPARAPSAAPSLQMNGFGPSSSTTSSHVNVLQPKKGKPKRVGFTNGAASSHAQASHGRAPLAPPALIRSDPFAAPEQPLISPSQAHASTARMFQDVHEAFPNNGSRGEEYASPRVLGKRKVSLLEDPSRQRGRTMGTSKGTGEVRDIRPPRIAVAGSSIGGGYILPVPSVQSILRTRCSDTADETLYIQADNAAGPSQRNRVTFCQAGQDQWLDYVPVAVLACGLSSKFAAVGLEDGALRIYTPAGRHLFGVELGHPVCEMATCRELLFIVTADCQARVYNTDTRKLLSTATSISHLLAHSQGGHAEIIELRVRPNGTPVILTSEAKAFAYNPDLQTWTCISSPWWMLAGQSQRRQAASRTSAGPLASIEARLAELSVAELQLQGAKPAWWDEAMEMGHLETRMTACDLLGSKEEYRSWLLKYTTFIAKEGFKGRAEEVVKELVGPVYHHPGKEKEWDAAKLGWAKRDLARQVLGICARAPALQGFAERWTDTLDAIASEEGRS